MSKSIGNTIVPEKDCPTVWRPIISCAFGCSVRTIRGPADRAGNPEKGPPTAIVVCATPCGICWGRCPTYRLPTDRTCDMAELNAGCCTVVGLSWIRSCAKAMRAMTSPRCVQAVCHLCHRDLSAFYFDVRQRCAVLPMANTLRRRLLRGRCSISVPPVLTDMGLGTLLLVFHHGRSLARRFPGDWKVRST